MANVNSTAQGSCAQSSTFLLVRAGTQLATYLYNQKKAIDRLTQEWSNVCESITTKPLDELGANAEGLRTTTIPIETFDELHEAASKASSQLRVLLDNKDLFEEKDRENLFYYLWALDDYVQKLYDIINAL